MIPSLATRRAVKATSVLILGLAVLPLSARGQTAGLSHVPVDAPVALVVPNMMKLSQKIAGLNRSMGINFPQLDDALGTFKQEMGATKGFRDDGPLVVVLTSIENFGAGEPPIVMLMPVSDYGQFVANYGGKADEAVTAVRLPDGSAGFAKKINGFAVMGPKKELVEGFKAGENAAAIRAAIGKLGGRVVEGSDLFLYCNVAVMAPTLQPKVQAIPGQMAAMTANTPAGFNREMFRTEMEMYAAFLTAGLRDVTTAVIGLDANDVGVAMTGSLQFRPGAFLAQTLGNGGEAAPQLAKLPNQPYIFAEAIDMPGEKTKALLDAFAAFLAPTQPEVAKLINQAGTTVEKAKGAGVAYYVPPPGAGIMALTSPTTVTVIDTTDSKAYLERSQQVLLSLNNTTIPINVPMAPAPAEAPGAPGAAGQKPPPPAAPSLSFTTQYVPNEIQVDGVSVDRYQIQMKFNGLVADPGNAFGPLAPLLGAGTSITGYEAATGNQVICTRSLDPALVKLALTSAKNGHGLGEDPAIGKVRQNLMPKASVEVYISVSGIISMVNNFMAMMGNQPINAPADLLPIGASVSFQDNGLAERMFVPISVVKFGYTTALPMIGGMMGGAAAPPPPGAAPAPGPGGAPPPRQGPAPAPF